MLIIRAIAGNRSSHRLVKLAARARFPHRVAIQVESRDTPSIASINVRYPAAGLLNARNAIWNGRFSHDQYRRNINGTTVNDSRAANDERSGKGIPGEFRNALSCFAKVIRRPRSYAALRDDEYDKRDKFSKPRSAAYGARKSGNLSLSLSLSISLSAHIPLTFSPSISFSSS